MRLSLLPIGAFFLLLLFSSAHAQSFRITISPTLQTAALDGRLLLMMAGDDKTEPRFQISDAAGTQLVFGVDVDGWAPGEAQLVGVNAFGYPLERLRDVPAGDYTIQVLLHKYETFHLKSGHTVKLPMDRGEGQ